MVYANVKKPFSEFKWRWASFTPSEGLNDPRVHLGVLRAMQKYEGHAPSSEAFLAALQQVENDLVSYAPKLNLVRDKNRNLLRNSQQYWSGLDLLASTAPAIELTPFGRQVAKGDVTRAEFAAASIRTLSLPNLHIERQQVIDKWEAANLKIFPLTLILSIIAKLGDENPDRAFLTNEELVRVVIPLSSVQASIVDQVEHVKMFRSDGTVFNTYDDFALAANDRRMSREYLLFLQHHGFLRIRNLGVANIEEEFFADHRALKVIDALLDLSIGQESPAEVADVIAENADISLLQRERRLVSVTARPGQSKFRREVLEKSNNRCLITGETLAVVLRACHIIPVEFDGPDHVGNGICLREDLHILFDSGHLRIDSKGAIHLSSHAENSQSYKDLARIVKFPKHVGREFIAHRWAYIN